MEPMEPPSETVRLSDVHTKTSFSGDLQWSGGDLHCGLITCSLAQVVEEEKEGKAGKGWHERDPNTFLFLTPFSLF